MDQPAGLVSIIIRFAATQSKSAVTNKKQNTKLSICHGILSASPDLEKRKEAPSGSANVIRSLFTVNLSKWAHSIMSQY